MTSKIMSYFQQALCDEQHPVHTSQCIRTKGHSQAHLGFLVTPNTVGVVEWEAAQEGVNNHFWLRRDGLSEPSTRPAFVVDTSMNLLGLKVGNDVAPLVGHNEQGTLSVGLPTIPERPHRMFDLEGRKVCIECTLGSLNVQQGQNQTFLKFNV